MRLKDAIYVMPLTYHRDVPVNFLLAYYMLLDAGFKKININ